MVPETIEDWDEVQELERDILLLYHQLAKYGFVMGDLSYGTVFSLPYWDFLNPTGLANDEDRASFVQCGCLVMLLAMAWERIDGSDGYLDRHRDSVLEKLATCTPFGQHGERLLNLVKDMVAAALQGNEDNERCRIESDWAYKTIVRGYFQAQAQRHSSGEQGA